MAMGLPDFWTVSGVGLALLAIAPAMTSVPGPGHWEFRISRICFVGAALLFLAKLAFWGAEDLTPVRVATVSILGAAIAVALAYTIRWVDQKQYPKESKIPALPVPAPILFNCQLAELPIAVPPSGQITTMDIFSRLESGSVPVGLGGRISDPGQKLTWFENAFEPGNVWRCDITNYADFPIFNVAMTFKEQFFETVTSKENPGSSSSGKLMDTSDRAILIANLDPRGTFSFYAYSQSEYYVQVLLPSEVSYLRIGNNQRENAMLLPALSGGMSFSPKREKPKSETKAN